MDSNSVVHNSEQRRFELQIDADRAVAEYELSAGRMLLTHTYVPPHLRGQGIAGKVVKAALDYAREKNLAVVPICPYVHTYIRRNPEYRDLVTQL